jgi:hypothetical protein
MILKLRNYMQEEDIKADLKMQPDKMFQATIARHYRFTEIEQRSYFGKCYMSHFTECSHIAAGGSGS